MRAEDEYTRYELLAPETASFRITYDVTAVTPGAKFFFNPIRKGSQASDESVIDLMTGEPLEVQGGHRAAGARGGLEGRGPRDALHPGQLARPVPHGRRSADPDPQDLQGSEELSPRRGRRSSSTAASASSATRSCCRTNYELVAREHSGAGDRGSRRPDRRQLHEHLSRRGAARDQGAAAEEPAGAGPARRRPDPAARRPRRRRPTRRRARRR